MITIDPADPEILFILGRPGFVTAPIAHVLQAAGEPIPRRYEDEQAAVILWLIRKYQEHGERWREKVLEDLRAMRPANPNAEEAP